MCRKISCTQTTEANQFFGSTLNDHNSLNIMNWGSCDLLKERSLSLLSNAIGFIQIQRLSKELYSFYFNLSKQIFRINFKRVRTGWPTLYEMKYLWIIFLTIPISPKSDIGEKSYGRSTLAYQNSPPKDRFDII